MITVKMKFIPSALEGREGSVYYQVQKNGITRLIYVGYKVFPYEWNTYSESVTLSPYCYDEERVKFIGFLQENVRCGIARLKGIAASMESKGISYAADDVVNLFYETERSLYFFKFMKDVIAQLTSLGRARTAETYTATLNSFMRFRESEDLPLNEIDSELIMLYEAFLKKQSLSMNTISFYMRILRAVYNRAVEKKLVMQNHPFKNVYTGIEKTVKRAISFDEIKKIKELMLPSCSPLEFARDMFLFSFYMRGMSFVDMAYLKKKDLQNGMLTYIRRKTGQQLYIKWEQCMQDIVDRYPNENTGYMLPIIKYTGKERIQYRNSLHYVNQKLKDISKLAGLVTPLTMYVARHSWASIAKSKNIPISIISEGMGHDSENTTKIYLAALDHSVIDDANELILSEL